jgi:LysM repeat protein
MVTSSHLSRLLRLASLLAAAALGLVLNACDGPPVGQVITRRTATPSPTATVGLATPLPTARPTATPAPYTPAPTFTPTITPTPVIYAIRSGDSLARVAQQFGVSIAELQDANGITDPRSLRIGQQLVIPQPAPADIEATPSAVPTPVPFAVENVTFNNTPLGGFWCLGEIHNTTGLDLEQAGVKIVLLDEQGEAVAEAQEYVQIELLRPGGRAPFAVRFTSPPQSFASYLAIPWQGVQGYIGNYYLDLSVSDLQGEGERYAVYTVSGSVSNTGPEDTVDVLVTVTLYDALGRVIGLRREVPEHNVIPRGGHTTFTMDLTPAGGPVADFRVDALGRRVPTPVP